MESSDQFLQFIGLQDKPILSKFIEAVANKGLKKYQKIIQWGGHNGQSLYAHVISGVFLILSLEEILRKEGVTDLELKLLIIAFCIHDLNKNYQGKARHYGDIAIPENVAKEIEAIGFDDFLEDWHDYLEDITEIIRGHSGHNSVRGDSLDRRSDSTKLGKKRLIELCHIIRAVDVADLSQNYSEQKHKQTFLSHLNRFTKYQYRLISHKISEQRGILTNIIHNRVVQYLSDKFDAVSIFSYPQGTYYLVAKETNLNLDEQDINKISESVENAIREMKAGEYAKFIENGNQGIKIKSELLQLGVEYEQIWGQINTLIQKKTYTKNSEHEQKCNNRIKKQLDSKQEEIKQSAQLFLGCSQIIPNDEELMRLGELLRTFYIFLSDHCQNNLPKINNKKNKDPWLYVYECFNILGSDQYSALDTRYDRAYVIAKDLQINYDKLLIKVIENCQILLPMNVTKQNSVIMYVGNNLSFNFVSYSKNNFTQHLVSYCQNNYQQSCYASSEFETSKWESGYVPKGIKVQQFSNFLTGGDQSEPKRYIDPIVQQQFSIEKLNFNSSGDKYLYLHLMPYSFMTAPFMESFKKIFEALKNVDISAVSLSIKEAINYFQNQHHYSLPINLKGKGGILVPQFSEVIGNVITLPVTTIGDNKTEKYLNAVEYTLLIHKYFGLKALLSESSIPIMDLTEHQEIDIFLDSVPSILKGLIPSEELRFRRNSEAENFGSGDILWQKLTAIREMHDLLHIKRQSKPGSKKKFDLDELFTLAKSFSISNHRIFFDIDRLIEKKAVDINRNNKDWIAIDLAKKLKSPMEKIMTAGS